MNGMWEGARFFHYYGYGQETNGQKVHGENKDESDTIMLHLDLGMDETSEVMEQYLDALQRKLNPFGYSVQKKFQDYDRDLRGIEIACYTFILPKNTKRPSGGLARWPSSMSPRYNTSLEQRNKMEAKICGKTFFEKE